MTTEEHVSSLSDQVENLRNYTTRLANDNLNLQEENFRLKEDLSFYKVIAWSMTLCTVAILLAICGAELGWW